ncbi:hypothetical protein [Segniliparus rugosus]|uniref:Uncharacterized protein n=1 Tax=Segniliparus rugosus (strain ATCC BAA-974 / DSM 45345 / CCUG 50838 / CIP 108380 / JCM 13579 / CDC 945) TaxID=679197 RepID=E5XT57_SEGRC|nr:hypothetical protein [Segniliparus rugosus]EFV12468.1 hypothetical protein HMPREF9336_02679 [Segniliparus rugosus ATCC BAA-974]
MTGQEDAKESAVEQENTSLDHEFWRIVGQGRRARAIAAGELVPVADAPFGFRDRAAFTRTAWEASGAGQSAERLGQILETAADKILERARSADRAGRLLFAAPPTGPHDVPLPLLAVAGSGDDGLGAVTFCLPEEASTCPK